MINLASCSAYGRWCSKKTGQSWRLPTEFEWEKSARGVDGRIYPCGDFCEPSWAANKDTREGVPLPASIKSFPIEECVYGVRNTAGNVCEWTHSIFDDQKPISLAPR
jgi:formylglycine-generating enzyme required for sulfatase activity